MGMQTTFIKKFKPEACLIFSSQYYLNTSLNFLSLTNLLSLNLISLLTLQVTLHPFPAYNKMVWFFCRCLFAFLHNPSLPSLHIWKEHSKSSVSPADFLLSLILLQLHTGSDDTFTNHFTSANRTYWEASDQAGRNDRTE